jgi:hypothetical protein
MTSSSCSLSLLVSVVFVVVLIFPKRPTQSRRGITSKKLRAYPPASASVSSSSSIATPLPLSPSRSSRPMNNAPISITGIDVVAVAGLRRRRGAHRCRGDRAEEDPVCQDEEGVVQAAHSSSSVAVAAVAPVAAVAVAVAVAAAVRRESLSSPRPLGPSRPTAGATMPPDRSVRRDRVVVDNYAADGPPDSAGMATRLDSCGGVGSGKNGVGGGSSTDRDNDDNDANGDRRRRRPRPRHRSRRAATAVAMMTMAGERGGEATARRLQGNDEATEMQRQSNMAPAGAS